MADLTFYDVFGEDASYEDYTDNITFTLGDLAYEGFDTEAVTEENINTYASKILWALLHKVLLNQPETNNDETRGIYVTNQGKRNAVRNNVAQFSFGLLVSAYTPDNLGVQLDADDMIPQPTVL